MVLPGTCATPDFWSNQPLVLREKSEDTSFPVKSTIGAAWHLLPHLIPGAINHWCCLKRAEILHLRCNQPLVLREKSQDTSFPVKSTIGAAWHLLPHLISGAINHWCCLQKEPEILHLQCNQPLVLREKSQDTSFPVKSTIGAAWHLLPHLISGAINHCWCA